MRVRFVTDYRGVLTAERLYPRDTVADLPAETAEALVRDGRAVFIEDDVADSEPARLRHRRGGSL